MLLISNKGLHFCPCHAQRDNTAFKGVSPVLCTSLEDTASVATAVTFNCASAVTITNPSWSYYSTTAITE